MYSVTSCSTSVKPPRDAPPTRLSRDPVTKSSMQTTSQSLPRKNSHRCEPMNPAPPVTSTRIAVLRRPDGLAADRVVVEAEPPHAFGLPEVPAIEDDRAPHRRPQSLEVQELELVPLRDEGDAVGPGRRGVRGVGVLDYRRQHLPRVRHGHRVVSADGRAQLDEPRDHLAGPGFAHVIG